MRLRILILVSWSATIGATTKVKDDGLGWPGEQSAAETENSWWLRLRILLTGVVWLYGISCFFYGVDRQP